MKNVLVRRVLPAMLCVLLIFTALPFAAFAETTAGEMTIFSEKHTALAPGITQNEGVAYNANGERVQYFVATADPAVSTVGMSVNYYNNQCQTYGLQKLTDQVAAAEANHAEPYTVIASVNASFYDMETGVPYGAFVMEGTRRINTGGHVFFGVLNDGTPIIAPGSEFSRYRNDLREAVSGSLLLVKDGEVNTKDGVIVDQNTYQITNPRTVVGLTADNKVIFFVADGRQSPRSAGMDAMETAQLLVQLGCVTAINLDGGGSSTYGAKLPGEDFQVINSPSDGTERPISASLLVYSTATPTGEFDHVALQSQYSYLTAGTSLPITALGLDATESPVDLPAEGLTWSVSNPARGTVSSDGVFTAAQGASGGVTVYARYRGNIVGSLELEIVVPESIAFSKKKVSVMYGEHFLMPLIALYHNAQVAINADDIVAVTNYSYDELVPEEELDNYGTFDGLYFNAPQESVGIRSEVLLMLPWFSEEEEDISTVQLEFYREGEAHFDFSTAMVQNDKLSWNREISNTKTTDNSVYRILNGNAPVIASYVFAVSMQEMDVPEDMQPMWDSLSGMLGDSVWDAFLKLANKVDEDTCVTIQVHLDPNFEFYDFSDVRIDNDLFTLDPQDISYDFATNTATVVIRWNCAYIQQMLTSGEGLSSDTVNSTVMVSGLKVLLKEGVQLRPEVATRITSTLSIAYSLVAVSPSAYGIAINDPELAQYAYQNGDKRGVCFEATYVECDDSYLMYGAAGDGWQGDSYLIGGTAVTGVHYLPSPENDQVSFYYSFDQNGVCLGKYNGMVTENGVYKYAVDGVLKSGWIFDNDAYYYFDPATYCAVNGVQTLADGYTYEFENCQLTDGQWLRTENGLRLRWAGDFANSRWLTVKGKTYRFDLDGYAYTGFSLVDETRAGPTHVCRFDENGVFLEQLHGNNTLVVDDEIVYIVNDEAVYAGLVQSENGDYYYIGTQKTGLKGTTAALEKMNDLLPQGTYDILTDGRVVVSSEQGGLLSYGGFFTAYQTTALVKPVPQLVTTDTTVQLYHNGKVTSFTVVKFGDIDLDGCCDGRDAMLLACVVNGALDVSALTAAQRAAADCSHDGIINNDDLDLLYASGLLTSEIDQNAAEGDGTGGSNLGDFGYEIRNNIV